MPNVAEYYSPSGWPATNAPGDSVSARSELNIIQAAFNKLPPLSGQGGNIVSVNAPGSGLNASTPATLQLETYSTFQAGTHNLLTSVAGANAITAVANPTLAAYVQDQMFRADAAAANTGAATIAINALAAIPLTRPDGSALQANDIPAAGYPMLIHIDVTSAILMNPYNEVSAPIHAAPSKGTPVNNDEIPLLDSAASFILSKLTWANLKATLAALTDTWAISTTGNAATATALSAGGMNTLDARYASALYQFTASVAANALTGTLASPEKLEFRNATLATGGSVNYSLLANLTLTVPSGATLGTTNGIAARLVWLVAYNAGSPVLCVVNLAGGNQLDETNLISPTTISGASNSANVIYSASAVGANSPYRVIGFTDITEAAAGTWATGPSTTQPGGGEALSAMGSFGFGQTWQTPARALGTAYYNQTGKMIKVSIYGNNNTQNGYMTANVNGVAIGISSANPVAGGLVSLWFEVQPGASYSVSQSNGTMTTLNWAEFR